MIDCFPYNLWSFKIDMNAYKILRSVNWTEKSFELFHIAIHYDWKCKRKFTFFFACRPENITVSEVELNNQLKNIQYLLVIFLEKVPDIWRIVEYFVSKAVFINLYWSLKQFQYQRISARLFRTRMQYFGLYHRPSSGGVVKSLSIKIIWIFYGT